MLRLCLFGSYSGVLAPDRRCCVTLFGACALKAPTMARQLLAARQHRTLNHRSPRHFFFTLFGTTSIKSPTLAEEFIDLREAMQSGALELDRWDEYITALDRAHTGGFFTLTLFATLAETELPSDDEEIESLALQRHFGNIGDDSSKVLEMGVGQSGVNRRTVIQRALRVA